MGRLAVKPLAIDDRLIVGAYVSKGICLYRIDRRTPSQVHLEDAYMLRIRPTSASDVLANYTLRRKARAIA